MKDSVDWGMGGKWRKVQMLHSTMQTARLPMTKNRIVLLETIIKFFGQILVSQYSA